MIYESYNKMLQPENRSSDSDSLIRDLVEAGDVDRLELEVPDRLATLVRLHEVPTEATSEDRAGCELSGSFLLRQQLVEREKNPSPYAVSLGIEVEIPKKVAMMNAGDKTASERKADYENSQKYVPGYVDGTFWEFAHEPVWAHTTLSREVQQLIHLGFIVPQYRSKHGTGFPLHVNIGYLKKNEDAYTLLRSLEATGWCSSYERLLAPYLQKKKSWTSKDEDMTDNSYKNTLGTFSVIEMRTFEFTSLTGLNRLLRTAFYLGIAARAAGEEKSGEPLDENQNNTVRRQLALAWEAFQEHIQEVFLEYGLKQPSKRWKVPSPEEISYFGRPPVKVDNPRGDFGEFAELLREAAKSPDSEGALFVRNVRDHAIHTRRQVKSLMQEGAE